MCVSACVCSFVTLVIVQLLRFFHPHPSLHQGNLHTRAAGHIIVIIYGYFYIPGTIGVNDTLCIPPAPDLLLRAQFLLLQKLMMVPLHKHKI